MKEIDCVRGFEREREKLIEGEREREMREMNAKMHPGPSMFPSSVPFL